MSSMKFIVKLVVAVVEVKVKLGNCRKTARDVRLCLQAKFLRKVRRTTRNGVTW
jgi:hypothetical protein